MLKSIDTIVSSIDLKLEKIIDKQEVKREETINEVKFFFDNLAAKISTTFIGDLPRSLELLEIKIDELIKYQGDFSSSLSQILAGYEIKIEERIKEQIKLFQKECIDNLNQHQKMHNEKLSEFIRAVNNLSNVITQLNNSVDNFDSERFEPAMKRLEDTIDKLSTDKKKGFFKRK